MTKKTAMPAPQHSVPTPPARPGLWLVTGTGTDVGKTVAATALLTALGRLGASRQAIKAVQTGCDPRPDGQLSTPDADRHALSGATTHTPFRFRPACSPHLAARLDGAGLSLHEAAEAILNQAGKAAITIVEGAGGLLVPLDERSTFAELALAISARLVVVVDNRLGAINAALLTLEAAERRGLAVDAIVFCSVSPGDGELEGAIRRDNITEIGKRAGGAVLAEIPHCPGLDGADADAARAALALAAKRVAPVAEAILAYAADERRAEAGTRGHGDGSSLDDDIRLDAAHLWHPYAKTNPPARVWHVERTQGNRIFLSDGRSLVDGMSSWWAAVHGYNHPRLVAALTRQAEAMPHVMFGGLTHAPAAALARRLLSVAPAGLTRIFYADSGSVAVEAAMKMALQFQRSTGQPGRTKFLTPRGGYHGDTQGAMSVCDPVTGMHSLFAGSIAEQIFLPRPAAPFHGEWLPTALDPAREELERRADEIAAVIVEPIVQGAGGMWFYHPEYLRGLRELCDAYGVLLVLDEIATGFGRTGKMFAGAWAGVTPDIMCVGKALTGGVMTLAAVMAREEVAEAISRTGAFMHGPTFMANPLACAVATASLDLLSETDWAGAVRRLEAALRRGLSPCRSLAGVADVRVLGAIGVVEMEREVNVERLQAAFVERDVWLRPFGRLIYVMPPFITSDADAELLTKAVTDAVAEGLYA